MPSATPISPLSPSMRRSNPGHAGGRFGILGSIGLRASGLMLVERRAVAFALWRSGAVLIPASFSELPRAFPLLTPAVCAGAVGLVFALPTRTLATIFSLLF